MPVRRSDKKDFPLPLLSWESQIFAKEKPDSKTANSALQYLRIDFCSVMGEEHLNALSFVCINSDTFLDCGKIIDICASKHPRQMLLINPLWENLMVNP